MFENSNKIKIYNSSKYIALAICETSGELQQYLTTQFIYSKRRQSSEVFYLNFKN